MTNIIQITFGAFSMMAAGELACLIMGIVVVLWIWRFR